MTRRRLALVLGGALVLAVALVDVSIVPPRVHVRWRDDVGAAQRAALEQRYGLEAAELVERTTWRYDVRDRSAGNVAALIGDANVADTAYIDRETFALPDRELAVSFRRARALVGPEPAGFLQLQSAILLAAGAVLLWAAGLASDRRRRTVAIGVLLAIGISAYAWPLRQPIRMGDSNTYVQSREHFEGYTGVHQIRFEAHLSHAILGQLDSMFGRTADSPLRSLRTLMRAATLWFLVMAAAAGFIERWSPAVLRYLALAVIGPSALLYFGYRELGHLSLNLAAFPLLVRGLREGKWHLEASGALAGLGAALHGFGLLAMAGSMLACLVPVRREGPYVRGAWDTALRYFAWSVAAYLGWIAVYLIVLELPVLPGHAEAIPLRPWFADAIGDRVNAAIFSLRGARDIAATALVVGVPLLVPAASLWRHCPDEARAAMLYGLPSVVFVILFWPIQGLAVEMDLLFAAFPASYALAWVCAQDRRRALAAAVLLACAHVVFWRVALDSAFVNSRIP